MDAYKIKLANYNERKKAEKAHEDEYKTKKEELASSIKNQEYLELDLPAGAYADTLQCY